MPPPDTPALLHAALTALLPAGTVAAVSLDPGDPGSRPPAWLDALWPEELPATRAMRPARLREFRHGRHCARRALAALGQPMAPIPVGAQRAPAWPSGVVGSISHAGAWAVAVAAPDRELHGLGADLEPVTPLEPALKPMIATRAELDWLAQLAADPGKLAFSAKESVYKCLWPLTGRFIEFLEIELLPGPQPGSFHAAWRGPGQLPEVARLRGRITVTRAHVVSVAWLAA
jgi:enterobactin synthetase component D